MSQIKIVIPHAITKSEALARIKKLLKDVKRQYGKQISDLKENWEGDTGSFSFKALGFLVAGTINVGAKQVKLAGDLPWQAALFKGKIESVIKERAKSLLS